MFSPCWYFSVRSLLPIRMCLLPFYSSLSTLIPTTLSFSPVYLLIISPLVTFVFVNFTSRVRSLPLHCSLSFFFSSFVSLTNVFLCPVHLTLLCFFVLLIHSSPWFHLPCIPCSSDSCSHAPRPCFTLLPSSGTSFSRFSRLSLTFLLTTIFEKTINGRERFKIESS